MSDKQAEKIQKLVENPNLNNWEKNFITSVNSYFQKHGRVSNKQWATIQKVEANYSPAVIAQRQAWISGFTDEMRQKWEIAMDYYENNPPYFQDLVHQVRKTAKGSHYRLRNQFALVVDNNGPVTSATKGAKMYSILPFGESAPIKIQERWLKKKRGSK